MSGLFSALFLRRRGWDVALYERSPVALTGRGAGIMTHPELHRAAAAAGARHRRATSAWPSRTASARRGGRGDRRAGSVQQIATSWNRLFEMLGGALGGDAYPLGKGPCCASRKTRVG